jgi:hypothetical protein
MNRFFLKLRTLLHRRRKEDDLRDELLFHLDEEVEERKAQRPMIASARNFRSY